MNGDRRYATSLCYAQGEQGQSFTVSHTYSGRSCSKSLPIIPQKSPILREPSLSRGGSLELKGIRPYDTAREIVAKARAKSGLSADDAMVLAVEETRRLRAGQGR